jgi:hypothetical protein
MEDPGPIAYALSILVRLRREIDHHNEKEDREFNQYVRSQFAVIEWTLKELAQGGDRLTRGYVDTHGASSQRSH